jgi:hypothetical protein
MSDLKYGEPDREALTQIRGKRWATGNCQWFLELMANLGQEVNRANTFTSEANHHRS